MLVATTPIDIVDTAVKIGLGAVIATVGSYLIADRSHKHEVDREYLRRRQDVIRDVSGKIAGIHNDLVQICVSYHGLVEYIGTAQPLSQQTSEEYTRHFKRIGAALKELYVLEGELLLVGAAEASAALEHYRDQVGEVNTMICLEPPTKTEDEVMAVAQELSQRRTLFYGKLATAFKNI